MEEARVLGVVYQRQPQGISPTGLDAQAVLTAGRRAAFGTPAGPLAKVGSFLLRLIHACPGRPNGSTRFGVDDLARFCKSSGCSLLATDAANSPDAQRFVRQLDPDLGIVYGTSLSRPELLSLPRQGSLLISHQWILSSCGPERAEAAGSEEAVRVAVEYLDSGSSQPSILRSTSVPIESYDTPTSLSLKCDLVGNDLLARAVADLVRGVAAAKATGDSSRPTVARPLTSDRQGIASSRLPYPVGRGRPAWKLLLRTVLLSPYVTLRNWVRRLRGSFPVVILYHHVVADQPHFMGIPTDLFLRQARFLKEHYRVASLGEAIAMLKAGRVEAPTVVLTLDDGYRDNFINLRAVTESIGIPATLFVCTGNVSLQKEFNHDLERGVRGFWPLTWEQIEDLSHSGFEIGSHTRSHFDCGSRDIQALRTEIVDSKTDLERRLGSSVRFFAFPWGQPANMSKEAIQLAKQTYPHYCSAFGGVNFPSRDGQFRHIRRISHPNDIWELELALQSILDF